MKYKLQNVRIIDPRSAWHQQVKDIIIDQGQIQEIGGNEEVDKVIDASGMAVLPGFFETYANVGDPGYEHREDLKTVTRAALKGGVTALCAIADNEPVSQHKSQIDYIIKNNPNKLVDIWPIGAVTENLKGVNPTEMLDMHHAGAIAFGDMPRPISNSGVMMRALQYVLPFDGIICTNSYDKGLAQDGQVNEGRVSIRMGVKGVPHLAETLQIYRDLELLEYTDGRLHISGVSTKEGVELIRKAKAKGLKVTASVYLHHLLFTEDKVSEFDTNYKVMPPLRTDQDQQALKAGLLDGTMDAISSQHIPLDIESKRLEFSYATPGMANMQFAFAMAWKALGDLTQIAEYYAIKPSQIFKKEVSVIEAGASANLILVNTEEAETISAKQRKSKSDNSPLFGQELVGVVKAVFNNQEVHWNE